MQRRDSVAHAEDGGEDLRHPEAEGDVADVLRRDARLQEDVVGEDVDLGNDRSLREHPHGGNARQLVAAVDDGHGEQLPAHAAVRQQLQAAPLGVLLDGRLLRLHLLHLLPVVASAPQTLESWSHKYLGASGRNGNATTWTAENTAGTQRTTSHSSSRPRTSLRGKQQHISYLSPQNCPHSFPSDRKTADVKVTLPRIFLGEISAR
ncbi:hypothetical protein EYF80_008808 [Liparis tanakae]|uniref:Uncharacterized protein n=1 Tax=Liparis tanakae TaxID=230148 RepID=A0A4Z2IUB7_9TELE|nr:hypothetical protein EYF80_008808 [Liparis tanakae]